MSIESALGHFGLSRREIQIYIALRKSGSLSVAEIGRQTGIPRVSVYSCLEGLLRRGVINRIKKLHRNFYEAQPPTMLLELLKQRFAFFESALPLFKTLNAQKSEKFAVQFYEGHAQCRQAQADHYELLAQKKVKLVQSIAHPDLAKTFPRFVPYMIQLRRDMGIATQLIVPGGQKKDIPESYASAGGRGGREMRVLPSDFPFNGNCLIGGGALLFIIANPDEPFSLLIKSKAAYEVVSALFTFVWNHLPP